MSSYPAIRRVALLAAVALVLISGNPANGAAQRGGRGGIRTMTLTSTAFTDGGMIPAKYAQPGRDVSPALTWTGAPDSTVSFVLIVHDADAPIGDGLDDTLHWLVWGIPGTATGLPEGFPQGMQVSPATVGIPVPPPAGGGGRGGGGGIRQISMSGPYYRGPAAPATGNPHHYVFELYALDANVNVQPPALAAGPPTRAAVIEAMRGHIRGKATLVGMFKRAAP